MRRVILHKPYPKQKLFMQSKARYTAYGGARGGGKSTVAREKAVILALRYPGAQILFVRRTYKELYDNHVIPMSMLLKCKKKNHRERIANFNETHNCFAFDNGSNIFMGYCDSEKDVLQYQGQAYDAIFLEEATQFTEFQIRCFMGCNRPSGLVRGGPMRVRTYFTCNPGGVGHMYIKRLFIDRDFEEDERPEDYAFYQALVDDNEFIMKNDPEYIRSLNNLPEDMRRAHRYGDWDCFTGQFFSEFRRNIHVCKPFQIPEEWDRYFVLDYGLDMLAGYWIAADYFGREYVYKELYEPNLIVSDAAQRINDRNDGDRIRRCIGPPDMWNRQKDTGKSIAEIFRDNGIYLHRAENDRISGWLDMKEHKKTYTDEKGDTVSSIIFFDNCKNLIRCLPQLQYDDRNPCDAAKDPHEITHGPDAIRYFVAGRPTPTQRAEKRKNTLPPALRTEEPIEEVMDW